MLELRKFTRGEPDSVLGRLKRSKASIGIPVRMPDTVLRERVQAGGQIDLFDIGGCGCALDLPE